MTVINVILSDDHLLGPFTLLREGIWGGVMAAFRRTWYRDIPDRAEPHSVPAEPHSVRAEPVEASAQRQRILSSSKEERARPEEFCPRRRPA